MPRPTPAQYAYGSATVVFSTIAMLLLSQASSGPGVIVIAVAGLALGLLVAVTVAMPWGARAGRPAAAPPTARRPLAHSGAAPERALSEHSVPR